MTLDTSQRRELKARAHHLKPVVQLGSKGLSDSVLAEAEVAIAHHELIKVRMAGVDRDERAALANEICERLRAELVGRIGGIAILYRQRPPEKKKKISGKARRKPFDPAAMRTPGKATARDPGKPTAKPTGKPTGRPTGKPAGYAKGEPTGKASPWSTRRTPDASADAAPAKSVWNRDRDR